MKIWCAAAGVMGLAAGLWPVHQIDRRSHTTLVVTGDVQGYLSPCGCTSPMTGGIKRMATAVRRLAGKGDAVVVVDGALVPAATGRTPLQRKQDVLKAQTLMEAYAEMEAGGVNLALEDAGLGPGAVSTLAQLDQARLLSGSVQPSPTNGLAQWAAKGPFLIGGISRSPETLARRLNETAQATEDYLKGFLAEAKADGLAPILLLDGGFEDARALAGSMPSLTCIVYRSQGSPSPAVREGTTWLVTPGDRGKFVATLDWDGQRFGSPTLTELDPAFGDDPAVTGLFKNYLGRVRRAKLFDLLPRKDGPKYAGAGTCSPCHAKTEHAMSLTAHAHALADLEKVGQDRDPDCVSCHVTGLESVHGFVTRAQTPTLANVTCESCHGPSADHVRNPKAFRLPKLDEKSCMSCHTTDNSPRFSFLEYWAKIRH